MNGGGIPSKRFTVWTRLYRRFLLEPSPASEPRADLATTIQPTTDADRLLALPDVRIFSVSITGTGFQAMATVPLGERWRVYFIEMNQAGGTWTHNRMDFRDPGGQRMPINAYAQTNGSEIFPLPQAFAIDELWDIGVNIDSFSVIGDGQLTVLIEQEDAF